MISLDFKVFVRELQELLKRTGKKNEKIEQAIRYQNEAKRLSIPIAHFRSDEIKMLIVVLEDRLRQFPNEKQARDNKWTRNKITQYLDLKEGQVENKSVAKTVEELSVMLKRYLELHSPHRWVFCQKEDRIDLPYFVDNIEYYKRKRTRDGDVIPAYTTLHAIGYRNGEKSTISATWSEDDYKAMTVLQALNAEDLNPETPKACEAYLAQLEIYAKYQAACGEQVHAMGDAFVLGDSWYLSYETAPMVVDGQPTRVVLDPLTEELEQNRGEDESRIFTTRFWDEVADRNGLTGMTKLDVDEDEDEFVDDKTGKVLDTINVMLPLHPYLYCFDLSKHRWINLHTANIQEYLWDKKLIDKLILPEEQKGLLRILMSTTGESVSDIVRGKMSGVIVLATGVPGVGKTLTAEVFSEFIEKPLYTVQCSQLGLNVETIEGTLGTILNRASRWGAVLLIDEADVYVRERGDDIQQNAIVGVFLRVLEYHRGTLFMTSNRNEIDDAILSRATAWIQYKLPDTELLSEIWRVLAAQYKVKLDAKEITRLTRDLPNISGRSVRNILKLATILSKNATIEDLLHVSRYQALEKEMKRNVR